MQRKGVLVISLDFELYWGVRDKVSLEGYRANLAGARLAIPRLLELFSAYGVRATWATVGLLFFETREALLAGCPALRPGYRESGYSCYRELAELGENEREDPYRLAPSLIRRIADTPGQEIGSHTFSHYYCLEEGQTAESFRADLKAAQRAASRLGLSLKSLVFPRNQCNEAYLACCREQGITSYRGTQRSWLYRARSDRAESPLRRGGRLLDSYLTVSGHNCHSLEEIGQSLPLNVPASRFLRPYSPRLRHLEGLRLRRIVSDLEYAAREGKLFHLWWHPHNFGVHTDQNLAFLERVLGHFQRLRERQGMESLNMGDLGLRLAQPPA